MKILTILVLILPACVSCSPSVSTGDTLGTEVLSLAPAGERLLVFWLFSENDCLKCQTLTAEIREARRGAPSFGLVPIVVHEGRVPSSVVNFLRRERLRDPVQSLDPEEVRRLFGNLEIPAVLVSDHGTLILTSSGNDVQRYPLSKILRGLVAPGAGENELPSI